MPTPKQLANLRPGKGRPARDTSQLTITLPNPVLGIVDRIANQQGWTRSKTIEIYLKKGFDIYEIGGYDLDDLTLIVKGAPID